MTNKILNGLVVVLAICLASGCASSKVKTGSSDLDGKIITIPCTVRSDVNFYRARGIGESIDLATSSDKALSASQSRIAQLIQAKVQKLVEDYTRSTSSGNQESLGKDFQQATRNKVNQALSNTIIACEQVVQKDNGIYTTYMGVEINKEDLKSSLNQSMMDVAQKRRIQYDSQQFFEKFDTEFNQEN